MLFIQVGLANVGMWAMLDVLHRPLDWWLGVDLTTRVTWLGVSVVAGGIVYVVVLAVLGLRPSKLKLNA